MLKRSDPNPRTEDGFVLIEILCALLIIGIASVAFLLLSSQSSARTFAAKSAVALNELSQSLMDVECQKRFADIREETGQSADQKLEWSISVAPLPDYGTPNNEQPVLAKISIEIHGADKKSDKPLLTLSHVHAYGHRS